jgi:nitric oxide reductase subunit B
MDTTRRLWLGLAALMLAGFGVLLWMGWDIHLQAPPIPERVVSDRGEVIYTRADIEEGRRVWQSIGGQQLGSIWGHGALVAPDWSADWLHREAEAMLELGSRADNGVAYAALDPAEQAAEQAKLKPLMRTNTYDPASGDLVVGERRAQAIAQVAAHYESLFSNDPATAKLREGYAMREDTIPDAAHRRELTAFFFWSAWATTTQLPNDT